MPPEQLAKLTASIADDGLLHDIVLYEGKILDGRNRYLACPPDQRRFTEYTGTSPAAFVVSQNLARRDLTSSQRAVVAHDLLPALEAEAKDASGRVGKSCRPWWQGG